MTAISPYRILYVDDNPSDRRLFQEVLSGHSGVDLKLASTGEELLELVDGVELPNLILMDWNLPGITGFDLLHRLKSEHPGRAIPVIVFTTSLAPEMVIDIYNARANCIVEKPIGFDAFCELVEKIQNFWLRTSILPVNLAREAGAQA